ncbi:WGR domain-containing protein [Exiguobacterium sp.]|uniref:WGR domain-containing protein n=1 Tax=Exiguobacterium sp. TaxID=44751 RepID=UPI00307DF746
MNKWSFEQVTKYWNIIIEGDEFVVNYGKIGTIGKVQVKSFESDSECMKEAEKLIRQKLRKGYVECPFDWDNHMYVDDPEVGPSFLTSHPKYQECFNDEFYVDCTEEYAPFGNDAGADALVMYEEVLRKDRDLCYLSYAYALIESWIDRDVYGPEDWSTYEYAYTCDQVLVAGAFASIKMTGKLTGNLKITGLAAIHRLKKAFEIEDLSMFDKLYERLSTFPTES